MLATDSFLIGDGLVSLLADVTDVKVLGRARDHDELLQLVKELTPEALIISIRTPMLSTMGTIVAARHLREEYPDMGIVVISDRGNGWALELLRGGASRVAYLLDERLPDIEAVLGALREVRAGQSVLDPSIVDSLVQRHEGVHVDDLTIREIDVLEQIAQGLSNPGIAAQLNVSVKAVEKHVTTIFRKLGLGGHSTIDRRVMAVLIYQRSQTSPFGPQRL
ncbi:MAG: response regulator transcription factor [Acidimicrobiales bacterium]